jgi:hypothetical protein
VEFAEHVLLQYGAPHKKGTSTGIEIFIKKNFRNRIHSYTFVPGRKMIPLRLKIDRYMITVGYRGRVKRELKE